MIDLTFKNSTANKKWTGRFFNKILTHSEKVLNLPDYTYGVSINLIGETKIKSLNRRYRGKNRPTDVLSFPLNESPIVKISNFYGTIELGDIFICLSLGEKEAKKQNKSAKEYLAGLTVHGFLHLLEYDHEKSQKNFRKMFALQSKILKTFIF